MSRKNGVLTFVCAVSLIVGIGPSVATAQPPGMVLVPAGEYLMGDHHDGSPDALPVHAAYIDAFYIGRYEVTNQQYADGLNWAIAQEPALVYVSGGVVYGIGNNQPYCDTTLSSSDSRIIWNGSAFGVVSDKEDHPIVQVSWYGSAAYANWRSAMERRQACYDTSTWECNFSANGYRLPTEAEWEKAARGGLHNPYRRFPWGDTIDCSNANFNYSCIGTTTPVGSYAPNNYGVYDMAGNVFELCNDWYSSTYYSSSPYNNPHGPTSGDWRVHRGGSWYSHDYFLRCAWRNTDAWPDYRTFHLGFRLVLDGDDLAIPTVSEWGIAAMTLLLLTAGTLVLGNRRRIAV